MPRVPFLDAPQVQQGAAHPEYQNVHAPTPGPAEFGAAVGEGLQQLGAGMGHAASIIEQEQQKADHAAAAGVATAFKDRANQVVSAYHSEEGENAIHAAEATNQALQKASEEVLSKAQVSARARNIARQDIQSDLVTARSAVRGHLAQQTDVAQDSAYKGQMASSLTAVANSFADPLVREQEIATGAKRVEDQAKVRGLGEDATKASVAQWRQDASAAVLNGLISSRNTEGARAYFEANREALGTKGADFAKAVSAMHLSDQAEATVSGLLSVARDEKTGWVRPEDAFRQVDTMEGSTELKDEIRSRLAKRIDLEKAFEKQQVEQHFTTAYTSFVKAGLGAIDPRERVWLEEKAPEKWDQLRKEARTDARAYRTSDAEARRAAAEERRAQAEANRLAIADFGARDVKDQAALNVETEYIGHADETTRLRIKKLQNRAQKDLQTGEVPKRQEFEDLVAGSTKGLDPKKEAPQFKAYMNGWRAQWYVEHDGKGPTREEAQKEAGAARANVLVKGMLWDSEKPKYKVDPAKDVLVPSPDAPASAAPKPEAAPRPSWQDRARELRKQGKDPKAIKAVLDAEGY